MQYRSVRQNDGTYHIQESKFGLNWSIIKTGVRGCNVNKIINRLHVIDLFKGRHHT